MFTDPSERILVLHKSQYYRIITNPFPEKTILLRNGDNYEEWYHELQFRLYDLGLRSYIEKNITEPTTVTQCQEILNILPPHKVPINYKEEKDVSINHVKEKYSIDCSTVLKLLIRSVDRSVSRLLGNNYMGYDSV